MTANQLNDGLWSWKGICHGWFQLAIGLLLVAILQGIQLRLLQNNAGLSTHSGLGCLHMDSQDMLSQGSKSKRQLVTFCHMLAEEIPLQFRDVIDADAFGGAGCTNKASQIGQHAYCQSLLPWLNASAENGLHFYLPSCTFASRMFYL